MTKIIALAAALSLVLPLSAQAPASSDPTAFALALHRRLAGGENIMTSPYSLRQFVANRPFLFVIEDMGSGTILFIGEVHDPR